MQAARAPVEPPRGLWQTHRDGLLHAALQNGWILAGVFLLGWSAGLVVGGIYLETLLGSVGLSRAVRGTRHAHLKVGNESVRDVTRTAVMFGLAQGVFVLVFLFGVLRDPAGIDPIWAFWPPQLSLMIAGALLAAAADYVLVRRELRVASDAWVRRRAERQLLAAHALILLMLVVPWSFLLIGERGMVVTLFLLKGALDVWMVGPAGEGAPAQSAEA